MVTVVVLVVANGDCSGGVTNGYCRCGCGG